MLILAILFSVSFQNSQSTIACTVTAVGAPVPGAEIVVAGKTYVTDCVGEVRIDGRWTVDAWAPLDGRNINGGVRVAF
jgi:hypothetical protein